MRPDDRVKTNGSRRGSNQATPKVHAGLDSHGAGRVVRRSSAEAELIDLRDRFVGTERFLRRDVQHSPEGGRDEAVLTWERVRARPRKAVWCRSVFERDTVMRTILMLHKDSPRTPKGLKPNNAIRR